MPRRVRLPARTSQPSSVPGDPPVPRQVPLPLIRFNGKRIVLEDWPDVSVGKIAVLKVAERFLDAHPADVKKIVAAFGETLARHYLLWDFVEMAVRPEMALRPVKQRDPLHQRYPKVIPEWQVNLVACGVGKVCGLVPKFGGEYLLALRRRAEMPQTDLEKALGFLLSVDRPEKIADGFNQGKQVAIEAAYVTQLAGAAGVQSETMKTALELVRNADRPPRRSGSRVRLRTTR
jgi:hypothetical protein